LAVVRSHGASPAPEPTAHGARVPALGRPDPGAGPPPRL